VSAPSLTRRRFLAGAATATGGVAAVALRPWRALVRVVEPTAAARLASLFAHPDSARAVGVRYLADAGTGSTIDDLVDEVAAGIPGGRAAIARAGDEELREHLSSQIREEFGAGSVVDVRGWVLSATEARLYAIAALV
jgi:hypothetical protein